MSRPIPQTDLGAWQFPLPSILGRELLVQR